MNDELRSSPKLISFVCAWEKFAAKPYLDQGNLLTWGYGHLQKPGEVPPKIITEQEAARIMAIDLIDAERSVKRGVTVKLTQQQFDALVSLAFNCGESSVNGSTLVGMINQGWVEKGAGQFARWNKVRVKGKIVPSNGLTKRRSAEQRIFVEGVYDSTH